MSLTSPPTKSLARAPSAAELFTPKLITVLREGYGLSDLRADLFAGLTVAIVALPLSMAIAIASGVTPERGLFTAAIGGFLISALGGSRFQIGGPAAAFTVLVASTVARHGLDGLLLATIMAGALLAAMGRGEVAVIPGFQGMMDDGRISTLGRGGSDTSAVAVAAAVEADRCDIYTDVDGVYTTDPRIVARARKLDYVTYEEMLELASVGAKVLQTRSVGLAMKMGVRVQVLSSFVEGDEAPKRGTMIVSDEEIEEHQMERQLITGIAHDKNEAKIIVTRVPDRPGGVANIFGPLAAAGINVDMIIQNVGRDKGETDVTFTVPAADLLRSIDLLEAAKDKIGFNRILSDDKVAKISVVGVGMKSHAGVASTMFRALADRGINIQAISTSEIKVSVLIDEDETELAVRVLHTAYGLDAD